MQSAEERAAYVRAWRARNKVRLQCYGREYYAAHREASRRQWQLRYRADRQNYRRSSLAWKRAHPEAVKDLDWKRRVKKRLGVFPTDPAVLALLQLLRAVTQKLRARGLPRDPVASI